MPATPNRPAAGAPGSARATGSAGAAGAPGTTAAHGNGTGHGNGHGHSHGAAAAGTPSTFRHSYSKDKSLLIRRLSRIEGQVRGIARMIEREEYCVDILQQTSALRAAVDALAILVLEDHVQGCVRTAAERGEADEYVNEVLEVVRRTLGRPVRGGRGA